MTTDRARLFTKAAHSHSLIFLTTNSKNVRVSWIFFFVDNNDLCKNLNQTTLS
jgi:hypothetical protein